MRPQTSGIKNVSFGNTACVVHVELVIGWNKNPEPAPLTSASPSQASGPDILHSPRPREANLLGRTPEPLGWQLRCGPQAPLSRAPRGRGCSECWRPTAARRASHGLHPGTSREVTETVSGSPPAPVRSTGLTPLGWCSPRGVQGASRVQDHRREGPATSPTGKKCGPN